MSQSLTLWSDHDRHKAAIAVFYNHFRKSLSLEAQKALRASWADGARSWLISHEGLALVFQHVQRQGADITASLRLTFAPSISAAFLSGLMLIALRWLARGGFEGVRSEKITNDLYDLEYSVLGSLCTEMLTEDKGSMDLTAALRCGAEARLTWFHSCLRHGLVRALSSST